MCMSTATWLFAAGPSRRKARRRRVLGPVGTGPRLERRPQRRGRCSFPLHRLFGSKRTTLERGQMLRRAVCETASNVYQPRPASPDRGHGVRRDDWGRRSEFASSFDSPVTSSSRAVASLLRRTGVDVCRLHVRSPGPWHSIPRGLASLVRAPFASRKGRWGDTCWLAVRRGTDASRSGNWASHASARPSRPCTGHPIR